MKNPIVHRELLSVLATRKGLLLQLAPAVIFALLVLARWPSEGRVAQSGAEAREVFRLFGYGLLATLLLLVPVFPAASIVRERNQGTLALLLNSPLRSWEIYGGKLLGTLGYAFLPLVVSLPAAAACYAMGGISLGGQVLALYVVFGLLTLQYAALGLWISSRAGSTDSALRLTYGAVLGLAVLTLGPHRLLAGWSGTIVGTLTEWLRCVSPIPAVMEILGQADVGLGGLVATSGAVGRFVVLSLLITAYFVIDTALRLKQTMLDRPRPQGVITQDRSRGGQIARRAVFLIDPQRRKGAMGRFTNPVLVKEFRSRRFGRSHWMLRLIALVALISLLLTHTATAGTLQWGVETIGGIMVLLQVALIVLITPSLAAGLISSEHERGGWTLLQMTPLSAGRIATGKLLSVGWTLALVLLATLPGYAVMIFIQPVLAQQIGYVLVCLVLAAVLALLLSATVGSFFRRTAPATLTAYALLIGLLGGTMLFWLGRDAPFGHKLVERVLTFNPMAAALQVMEVPGFTQYQLVPANWWLMGLVCGLLLLVFGARIWRLTRPM